MRRTTAEMLITREQILNAAFACFLDGDVETISMEKIARKAGVTRGAIYWHFSDKKDLFRAVAEMAMQHGDVSQFYTRLPAGLSLEQRLTEIFWTALNENPYVDFVFSVLSSTGRHLELDDALIFEQLRKIKKSLVDFLEKEIEEYMRANGIENQSAALFSHGLFLMFEGMFLTKNIPVGIDITKDSIGYYISAMLGGLLGAG